jgi:hypothetical protein
MRRVIETIFLATTHPAQQPRLVGLGGATASAQRHGMVTGQRIAAGLLTLTVACMAASRNV